MTAIAITLPANIEWSDYERELDRVKDGREVLNFKVSFLPKNCQIGDRCYLIWRNKVRGWMPITGLVKNGQFYCTTTHKLWKGSFIQRSGQFHPTREVPRRGFQGFRYLPTEVINTLEGYVDASQASS